ncbi:hypothetical protein K1719_045508 [Acacia pycnantha]|nr:hypothetical protein K1719_045508 [Acacia pycnantha]
MKATKLYEQRTITSTLVRNLCFSGVTPRVVRISVCDNYATDSSSDEEDERGARFSRPVKKFVHEIRIEDLSSFRANSREVNGDSRPILKKKKRERPPARMARRKQSLPDGKKFRGVRQRLWGRWAAEIRDPILGARKWLGTFDTAEEAALVYDIEAIRLRGADAQTNLIKPPDKHESIMLPSSYHESRGSVESPLKMKSEWLENECVYDSGRESRDLLWSSSSSPTSVLRYSVGGSCEPSVWAGIEESREGENFLFPDSASSEFVSCCYSDYEIPLSPPLFFESDVPQLISSEILRDIPFQLDDDFESSKWVVDHYFQAD